MSRVRIRRLDPWQAAGASGRGLPRQTSWSLGSRADAAGDLDLGSRIGLAADVQSTAGNAAMAHLVGLVRTDHKTDPPGGLGEIMALSGPGNRGLTKTAYTANPPMFRGGAVEQAGTSWVTRPAKVKLRELEHEVYWPADGLHKIRSLGKGTQFLDVSVDWSNKLGEGETEHVTDSDMAYAMTWGKVAAVLNKMAEEKFTGPTVEAAQQSAWQTFKARLPEGLKPEGDTPTAEAQEKKWGADDKNTIFRKMMNETKRARDFGLAHARPEPQGEPRRRPDRRALEGQLADRRPQDAPADERSLGPHHEGLDGILRSLSAPESASPAGSIDVRGDGDDPRPARACRWG